MHQHSFKKTPTNQKFHHGDTLSTSSFYSTAEDPLEHFINRGDILKVSDLNTILKIKNDDVLIIIIIF